jgi:FMN phosphatase YigB (HAD superfamily)
MSTVINAVLFDMDGVLYAYDRAHRLELLSSALDVSADEIHEKIFASGLEDDHDWGRIGVEDYIAEIGRRLNCDVTLRQWRAARKWAMAPEPEMLDLAKQLSARVQVALMTNNGRFFADAADELAPELREVFGERMYFSGVLGCGKEDAATFGVLMADLGWQAASTLFVDDDPFYIAAACEAGLTAHHFSDVDGFKAYLAELGLAVS